MQGKLVIGTEIDTKEFDAQIDYISGQLEDIEDKLKQADMGYEVGDVQKLEAQYEKLSNRLKELVKRKEQFNRADFSSINTSIESVGNSLSKVIKRVTRWGLAVFGIRGAYMAVRNAINTISQDDEQLKADIDYMKNAIAYVLEPVVRKVVEWAKQLVFYIGYLIKAWTGHDIFASANKNLKKSVGSAKELNKQLTVFDEMNVLSDSSSTGGVGGDMPSFNFEDMEVPDWLIKIKDIGQWIIDNWEDVVITLLLIKLFIDVLTGNWLGIIIDLVGILIVAFFKLKDAIKVIKDNWLEAWGIIKVKFEEFVEKAKEKFISLKDFIKGIISTIVDLFRNIGTKVGDAIGGAFKAVINGVLSAIENILNFPIRQVNKLLNVINKVPGINISKLSTFSLPRLARGGIVNMPSRGVPVGNAIAGERGAEGVIPLTDSQQMMLLGEAIGKYITVNANITNTMNGRVISRELQKVQNETNFAMNR